MNKTLQSEMIYFNQTVKIIKTGHFPDTVIIRLSDDKEAEVYVKELQQKKS